MIFGAGREIPKLAVERPHVAAMKAGAIQSVALVALALGLVACGRSPNPAQQASELEATLQKLGEGQPEGSREVFQQAITFIRSQDYVSAEARLHAAQKNPQSSGELRAALNQAQRAISAQLTARALRGDQEAVAALQAIEKTRNR